MESRPVPLAFAFLQDALQAVQAPWLRHHFDAASLHLKYTSDHRTQVSIGDHSSISIDVRMVEAVCDFVSCLQLEEESAAGTRAYLLFFRTAIDLKLGADPDDLRAGMILDYLVSRCTAHSVHPEALSPEAELDESAQLAVAETAGKFILLHELGHVLLDRDPSFRQKVFAELRSFVDRICRHSGTVTDPYREAWIGLQAALTAGEPYPPRLDEVACDYLAARALVNGARLSPVYREDPSLLEAALFATSMTLWTLAAMRALLRPGSASRDQKTLARELVIERAAIMLFVALELRLDAHTGDGPLTLDLPFLDKLTSLLDKAAIGWMEPDNLERLESIGRAALRFHVSDHPTLRASVTRMLGWAG